MKKSIKFSSSETIQREQPWVEIIIIIQTPRQGPSDGNCWAAKWANYDVFLLPPFLINDFITNYIPFCVPLCSRLRKGCQTRDAWSRDIQAGKGKKVICWQSSNKGETKWQKNEKFLFSFSSIINLI